AVDDTIHFLHNFRRYHERTGDAQKSVHMTLMTTGRAMLVTSLALMAGFIVFAGATMVNISNFGIITAFTIATAFLADVMLSPALVILATRARAR
ncbi:MAG: MMPL family transporter, partial [Myxococcales bacterium]|nr:MMPL family transporter [Myxococcales bacterium]